jgi:hypothetical protein
MKKYIYSKKSKYYKLLYLIITLISFISKVNKNITKNLL